MAFVLFAVAIAVRFATDDGPQLGITEIGAWCSGFLIGLGFLWPDKSRSADRKAPLPGGTP